ncbi:MAG: DUF3244 domain-containing protein [Bacteroidaceae bacterium]|nr:DUF3244 domain-containing protein [Bacteroidaceae bacterium]
MKKAVMILALLCYTLSSFAEKKPIELEENKRPHKRSEVQLPTASISIDGLVLTIDFVSSTTFEVTVVNASGVVVYTGVYSAQGAVIILPNLPVGEYQLEIEDAEHLYGGEFEIEQ